MCWNLKKKLKYFFTSLLGQLLLLITIQFLLVVVIFPALIIYFQVISLTKKGQEQINNQQMESLISKMNIVNLTLQNIFKNAIIIITVTQNQILQLINNKADYNMQYLCVNSCKTMNSNVSINTTLSQLNNHINLMNSQESLIKNMQIFLSNSSTVISIPATSKMMNYKVSKKKQWDYNIFSDSILLIKKSSFGQIIANITKKDIAQKFDGEFRLTQLSSKFIYFDTLTDNSTKQNKQIDISIRSQFNISFNLDLPLTIPIQSSIIRYSIIMIILLNICILFPIVSFLKSWVNNRINPLLRVQNILQIKLDAAFKQENIPKINILCKTKVMQEIVDEYMNFSQIIKRFPQNQKQQIRRSPFKFENRLKQIINEFQKYIKPIIDERILEIINNKKILISVNSYFEQEEKQLRILKRQCQKNYQEFFRLAFLSMIQIPSVFYQTLIESKTTENVSQVFYNINIVLKSKDFKIFCQIQLFSQFLREAKQQMYYPIIRRIQNLLFPKYLSLFKELDIGNRWIQNIKFHEQVSLLQQQVENIRYQSSKLDRHLKLYK